MFSFKDIKDMFDAFDRRKPFGITGSKYGCCIDPLKLKTDKSLKKYRKQYGLEDEDCEDAPSNAAKDNSTRHAKR